MFVLALAGGSVMPYLTGVLGDSVGLKSSFLLVPASLIVMIGLHMFASRKLTTAT
jgi:fucose permease